jgi:heme/copper-type cytochrome/quinol oxidase subunit 1
MRKKIVPYSLFGIMGLLLFALSFFIPSQTVDIHVHDTYYVLDSNFITNFMAILLLMLFTLCSFLKQQLSSLLLSWLHVVFTFLAFLLVMIVVYKGTPANQQKMLDGSSFQSFNSIVTATVLLFLLGQVFFVVNVIYGVLKRTKRLS